MTPIARHPLTTMPLRRGGDHQVTGGDRLPFRLCKNHPPGPHKRSMRIKHSDPHQSVFQWLEPLQKMGLALWWRASCNPSRAFGQGDGADLEILLIPDLKPIQYRALGLAFDPFGEYAGINQVVHRGRRLAGSLERSNDSASPRGA